MIPSNANNPFTPGSGIVPPAFPGREKEQAEMGRCIKKLEQREKMSRDIIISAPRGNGKTAFLSWYKKAIRENSGNEIDFVSINPNHARCMEDLIRKISLPGFLERINKKLEAGISVKTPGVLPAQAEFRATLAAGQPPVYGYDHLESEIKHRCRKKPLVLIIDEAHRLDARIGNALFNASQETREDFAFQLVLAGTPGLQKHIGNMGATFWERSNKMRPGLLSGADTRHAIVAPLEKFGVTFDENALDYIIKDSQGYPYFIQLWGENLFNALQESHSGHAGMSMAERARENLEDLRQDFYQERFDRLDDNNMVDAAALVAEHFETSATCGSHELKRILENATHPDKLSPEAMKDILVDEGYIWRANPQAPNRFHPGIPSLMTYVKNEADTAKPHLHDLQLLNNR